MIREKQIKILASPFLFLPQISLLQKVSLSQHL